MSRPIPRHTDRIGAAAFAALVLFVHLGTPRAAQPRFYPDDPIAVEPETQDASGVRPWSINLTYDILENTFASPGDRRADVKARNVNTIGEVPDSSWFTNRAGTVALQPDDVAIGPDTSDGPASGTWTVTAAKSDGITPGFTIVDATGERWFIKFDPPDYLGMATGAEVIVTKLFWALGYHVPENHIASLDPAQLVVSDDAMVEPPGRRARRLETRDIRNLLARASQNADGSYRVLASRALPGTPLGGFRLHGTRPDDPNDIVPHEHRRELRGYRVFAAWVNHVDSKSINTLDTLVSDGDKAVVRHHLLDFGSTLGSGAVVPRETWEGYEYLYEGGRPILGRLVRLGFPPPLWRTIAFFESPAIGRFPRHNTSWDPDSWRPRVPAAAFRHARSDDLFWAARKLAALGDDLIRAAVHTGRLGDEADEAFLSQALIERRDAIARTYLTAVNPVVDPALSAAGDLTFHNAALQAGVADPPPTHHVAWTVLDNATGTSRPLGESVGTPIAGLRAPAALPEDPEQLVGAAIRAGAGAPAAWERPVQAYFRRQTDGTWKLVGLERLPDGASH